MIRKNCNKRKRICCRNVFVQPGLRWEDGRYEADVINRIKSIKNEKAIFIIWDYCLFDNKL